jgi:hypothetical protein
VRHRSLRRRGPARFGQAAPQNIAWIQCVGSRRVTDGDNSYCSATCCTYTQKQVILTKDHDAEAACTIFHNDIRSFGKDFERLLPKGRTIFPDVRFIRSYASVVGEDPETDNVIVRYATDEGVKEESFDMVVLSVGLNPPPITGDWRDLRHRAQCPRVLQTDSYQSHGDQPAGDFRQRRFPGAHGYPRIGVHGQRGRFPVRPAARLPAGKAGHGQGSIRRNKMFREEPRASVCSCATAGPTSAGWSMCLPPSTMP